VTEAHVLEDAERLIAAWNGDKKSECDDLLADDRQRNHRSLLGSVGVLSRHQRNRSFATFVAIRSA
jgi:hypothetical protein